jgi:hypothetical protein
MTYQKRIEILLPEKATPFVTILRRVLGIYGSERAAAKALGISPSTFRKLLDERFLTDKTARKILATYRLIKHHLPESV